MCRNKSVCSELGENPDNWSFFSPLPPPVGFSEAHEIIQSVIELISFGKIDLALEALHTSLEQEIKSWYQEHGQMSGSHRFRALGGVGEPTYEGPTDPIKSVSKFEDSVYARDSFRCKYCSNPVLDVKVLKGIEKTLGADNFAVSANSNEGRHGFIYILRATVDHVIPHNRGGLTSMDNLITSCWSCNYGKSGYTLQEIALEDPR